MGKGINMPGSTRLNNNWFLVRGYPQFGAGITLLFVCTTSVGSDIDV
jgi:hypothetical protein